MRIGITRVIIFCSLLSIATPAASSTIPPSASKTIPGGDIYKKIASLKVKDIQKLIGRKLTWKERIVCGLLKHKLKHRGRPADDLNKGETALIFGIGSLVLLLISFLLYPFFFGALGSAILAIVVGSSVLKKDRSDKDAKTGKLLGWITLGLITALILVAVAALNAN